MDTPHLPMVAASLNLTFVYLNSVDEAAIMEQWGRFGGIRMVWTPEYRRTTWKEWFTHVTSWQMDFPVSMIEGRASSPCLNCVGWQDMSFTVVRKIERPPLILTVLGGRTRAHLDNSSQGSSPYLNCVGWQDKPTVELSMVLDVALSGCHKSDA